MTPCNCKRSPVTHVHAPAGKLENPADSGGLPVLPFRPGKTKRKNRA